MSLLFDYPDRNIFPRWREFKTTVAVGELQSIHSPKPSAPDDETELIERKEAWENNPTLAYAGDFVGAALVFGQEKEAEAAAEFILQADSAPLILRRLATKALGQGGEQAGELSLSDEETHHRIRLLRNRIADDPRNAVAWVDLARYYTILGQHTPSVKAMKRALILSPDNRFVLRSATRLFLINHQPEVAHYYLSQSPRTKADPWLLAPEIAVATATGKISRLIKEGQRIVDNASFAPADITELASALAKLELNGFNLKNARRLFRRSLQSPTENSLAQASWVAQQLSEFDVPANLFDKPYSFEANARRYYQVSDWQHALGYCRQWLQDEPFAGQPAVTGSYLSIVTVGDYILSERFARMGLLLHPKHPTLLNNLTVALAHQNRLSEAHEVYDTINSIGVDVSTQVVLEATRGLLNFRAGNIEEGRRLYQEAINMAGQIKDVKLQALAWIHLAHQEMLAGTDQFEAAFVQAKNNAARCKSIEVAAMIERVAEERQNLDLSAIRFKTGGKEIFTIPARSTSPRSNRLE